MLRDKIVKDKKNNKKYTKRKYAKHLTPTHENLRWNLNENENDKRMYMKIH